MKEITIILPIYNGESTLGAVFKGLETQDAKSLVDEIILIDDNSKDGSLEKIEYYKSKSSYNVSIVKHRENLGLAATYNHGIDLCSTALVVVMHQDILLTDKHSLKKIVEPFHDDLQTVATYPSFVYPYHVWVHDSFWQKVLFSRLVDKKISKLNGKFDCYKKSEHLIYDHLSYRTAGEDFDIEQRLREQGKVTHVSLTVTHLQENNSNFTLLKMFKKEAHLAESYGVNLRRYYHKTRFIDYILILLRPGLLIGVFIPNTFIRLVSLFVLISFSFLYSKNVYIHEWRNPRIFILPLMNIFGTIIYSLAFISGLASNRQRL